MNILIVSTAYHPSVGGVQTQARLVAHWMARQHRIEVAAVFLGPKVLDDGLKLPRYKSYVDGAVAVHALTATLLDRLRITLHDSLRRLSAGIRLNHNQGRDDGRGSLIYQSLRSIYVPKLRALMRDKDLVHCVDKGYLGWAAEEAARAENVPFVLTPYVHTGYDGEDESNVAFYQRADIVFGLVETDVQKLIDLGVTPERIRLSGVVPLLPRTTDPKAFRLRHGLGNKPVVLFVGRMIDYKGFSALLDAAPLVWRVMPDVIFLFAGAGDAKAEQCFAARPDDRIRNLGLVSDQEKGDALATCDLFCMPSVKEILPAVYLEAWSYGKPVVGGTAHGLCELIEGNGGGITVEQNPELIGQRIIELLRDEPRRRQMGERGRALVERRFSEAALFRALEAAYEDVCRTGARARLKSESGLG